MRKFLPSCLWYKFVLLGILLAFVSILLIITPSYNRSAAATPEITPALDRLAKPEIPDDPSQADLGAVDYWFSCMVCHGDRGQGLTEEWRAAAGQEDMNCWQSRCHASNHPPEGFVLPTYAPRIIGEYALFRFETALDLYEFISTKMPWQMPGLLEDTTYWQLSAFLLRENAIPFQENGLLNAYNADSIRIRPLIEDGLDVVSESVEDPSADRESSTEIQESPTSQADQSNYSIILTASLGAGLVLVLGYVIWSVVRRQVGDPN